MIEKQLDAGMPVSKTALQALDILKEVQKAVIGKDEVVKKVLMVILANGHILIEDIPGVGKTTLALAFSKAMALDHKRLQFTPDVMPTDVTGFSVYNKQTGTFEFKPGAAMCNLFLADEINRTSSKTQSALLEVMEEGKITVDGVTHQLPRPYTVIATQNPIGYVGTQMLPESQLDRFMVRLQMGYPDMISEYNILKAMQGSHILERVQQVATMEDILKMQQEVVDIYMSDAIYTYIVKLVAKTRTHPFVELGVSTRGGIALTKLSKACAYLNGRDYVVPEDVANIASDVMAHRLVLNTKGKVNNVRSEDIVAEVQREVSFPKIQ